MPYEIYRLQCPTCGYRYAVQLHTHYSPERCYLCGHTAMMSDFVNHRKLEDEKKPVVVQS